MYNLLLFIIVFCTLLENKKKNRYKNIVPCDRHYEVVLGKDGGYINANFIKMLVKDESFHYIACQGPLPTTLGDFWQMVWEQKSNVICQRYWPDASHTAEMVGERLQITLVKDQHLENFVIRLIEVKDIQVSRTRVTHLNYTGWPDHGTPTQPEQLLTFISYMRHIHQSGPIITHCSAGIGRSGTLICIDVVLGLNQQRPCSPLSFKQDGSVLTRSAVAPFPISLHLTQLGVYTLCALYSNNTAKRSKYLSFYTNCRQSALA
uniref:Protein tyrosine phosphatase non-receptor type 18 n=1 Tax=Astyanax mexicanus TaxID=7994 RepID=A0A3B1K0T1_ASTMX